MGDFNVPVPETVDIVGIQARANEHQNNPLTFANDVMALRERGARLNQLLPLEIQGQTLTNQRAAVALTADQAALAAKQNGYLNELLAQTRSPGEVAEAVARGVRGGLFTEDFAARMLGGGAAGIDYAKLRQQAILTAGNEAERAAEFGTAGSVNQGGIIQGTITKVGPGGVTVDKAGGNAAALPVTQTPAERMTRVPYVDETGTPRTIAQGSLYSDTGEARPVPGVTGAGGSLATGLAPGAGEARRTAGEGSGAQLAADRAEQGDSARRVSILREVNSLLESPQGQTGPGTQMVNGWRNFLLANAPALAPALGLDRNQAEAQLRAATQDEIKKYMTQIAAASAAQFGAGTNEKLAVAASGNANPDMSNLANRDVTRMNLALERAKQARLAAWGNRRDVENYAGFVAGWNRDVDPRAFMLDLLTPAERQRLLATITTDADKSRFLKGKRAAVAAGLFSDADIPR